MLVGYLIAGLLDLLLLCVYSLLIFGYLCFICFACFDFLYLVCCFTLAILLSCLRVCGLLAFVVGLVLLFSFVFTWFRLFGFVWLCCLGFWIVDFAEVLCSLCLL